MILDDIITWAMKKHGYGENSELKEQIFLYCQSKLKYCNFNKNPKSYFAIIALSYVIKIKNEKS